MELWYTEEWTDNVRFSIKVDKHLFSDKSEFQQVDVFESKEFGKFLTLDGLMMVNYKDEFIYHDMIVHTPMATNINIKNVLVIGGGDGGTVRELTRYPHIEKIDMVEIDKMVVDVSRKYNSINKKITIEVIDDITSRPDITDEYGITATRGKWIEKNGIIYMPTWHPAALLRDENKKIEFWRDLKEVVEKYKEI